MAVLAEIYFFPSISVLIYYCHILRQTVPHTTLSFTANVFIVRGSHHIQPCPRKYVHFMAFMCHMSNFFFYYSCAVSYYPFKCYKQEYYVSIRKSPSMSCSDATTDTLAFRNYLKGLLPSVVPFSLWCFNGFTSKCLCCPALSELTHPATLMVICPWGEVAFKCQHMMLQHRPSRNWRKDH